MTNELTEVGGARDNLASEKGSVSNCRMQIDLEGGDGMGDGEAANGS